MTLIDKAKSCGAQIDRSMPIALAVFAQHELEAFAALIRREALEEAALKLEKDANEELAKAGLPAYLANSTHGFARARIIRSLADEGSTK